MGNHCLVWRGRTYLPLHVEIWLRHVEVDDHEHAATATHRGDAQDQRALQMQCVRSGTTHGDGTRRRPATAKALP